MRIAINGYGRIGRCFLRALFERVDVANIDVVAINELAENEAIAYLTQYDSTHGRFPAKLPPVIEEKNGQSSLLIDGRAIHLYREKDPGRLPWQHENIDLVLECTGAINTLEGARAHIAAGAARVMLSNPGENAIPAIVFGVNQQALTADQAVFSAASCTSNALSPVLAIINESFGIANGVITTIHASMHDQPVIDAYHSNDLRKNRAASESLIPVDTELAVGLGRILPSLEGKFVAQAVRVPVNNVSAINVTMNINASVTVEQLNSVLQHAADNALSGVLGYTTELLASCDFNHDARSAIIDGNQTRVVQLDGKSSTVNLFIWFDNEWAFANRMLDLALFSQS